MSYWTDDAAPEESPGGEGRGLTRFTVTEFTRAVKNLIETSLPFVAVEGEVSNYIRHAASGHRYFTLKDANAQLKCVMFKWQAQNLSFEPEEGMQLLALGNPTVYERGGQYQLTVVKLLPLGRGELLARLEDLKKKLAAEGVFDNQRPLPRYPMTVGVVTSPTGAAVRDIISVLSRRAPYLQIVIRPALVQGAEAPPDIARAIDELNDFGDIDVIIVGRGGGSIEDLWCFNEEITARAIASSRIPVVSAVGHETDFTLADFAADLRAPTPSAAAELIVRDRDEIMDGIETAKGRLKRSMLTKVDELSRRVDNVRGAFGSERFLRTLMMRGQAADELSMRLRHAFIGMVAAREKVFERLNGKLAAMNPRSVLERGYSIVFRERDGAVVTDAGMVESGDSVRVELARGSFAARVENGADKKKD